MTKFNLAIIAICMFITFAITRGHQPMVPCDTDMDCMIKNPHVSFSLEGN